MPTTLVSSFHVESTASFARTPPGEVFIANGLDRPRKWDGFSAATVVVGLDAPTVAPTVTEDNGGNAELGTYFVAYRYGDAYGNYSNLSPVTTVTTSAVSKRFDWDVVPIASGTDSSARITKRQLFRTVVDDASAYYLVHEIADNTTTSYTAGDTLSDDDLVDNEELPVLNDDDSLSANRFGVPPMNKAVVVWNQDRLFYLADVIYSTGTVSISSSSGTVTGVGTSFTASMIGKWIYMAGDSRGREVTAVASTTSITVSPVGDTTLSGVAFELKTNPAERNVIYFSEPEEPESVPQAQNQFLLQENNVEQDEIVGGFSDQGTLIIGMTTHLYQFNYQRQPHLDGAAQMIARRGMFNNRCHGVAEGVHFLMDRYGPYMLQGGQIRDIGGKIKTFFRDGSIDQTYARYFFVGVNQREQTVKFYVRLTTDTAVSRAFTYHYAQDRWSVDTYAWGVGGSCELEVSGSIDTFVMKAASRATKETFGTSLDGLSAVVSGTTSGVSSTQIVDLTGPFLTAHITMPFVVTSGSAKGQRRYITSRPNTQNIFVDSSISGFAAGDTYVIGGIPWNWHSGLLDYPRDNQISSERAIELTFAPHATNGNTIDIRHYLNHKTSPETAEQDYVGGDEACSQAAASADGVVDLYRSRNSDYETVGFARKTFTSRHAHYSVSDRWLGVELRGITRGTPVEVYELAVMGAK